MKFLCSEAAEHRYREAAVDLCIFENINDNIEAASVAKHINKVKELAANAFENARYSEYFFHTWLWLDEVVNFFFKVIVIDVCDTLSGGPRH
jgi:hypothetical protein